MAIIEYQCLVWDLILLRRKVKILEILNILKSSLAKILWLMLEMPFIILKLIIKHFIPCTKQAFVTFNSPFIRVNPFSFILGDSG